VEVQPKAADVDEPSWHCDLLATFRGHTQILSRTLRKSWDA
jgi:hypothetical protein